MHLVAFVQAKSIEESGLGFALREARCHGSHGSSAIVYMDVKAIVVVAKWT